MKWEIKQFNSLKSTNLTAKDYSAGVVVVAEKQTAGVGRYGRSWQSPKGNLYASFVFESHELQDGYLSFITGLALAESLPEFDVRLKWPNDVLMDGKKISGILLEKTDDKVIVGVGVNLISHPEKNMLYPAADLGGRLSVGALLKRLMLQYDVLLDILKKNGFEALRRRWLDLAVGLNDKICLHLPEGEVTGVFKGISEEGALILKTKNEERFIFAGDVFLI